MGFEVPSGYRLYGKVIACIGPVKVRGDGLSFRCLFPERHRNGDKNWSGRAWIGPRGNLMAKCMACGATWKEFVAATETTAGDWWPDQGQGRRRKMDYHAKPNRIESYFYHDAKGNIVAVKDRWEPGFAGNKRDFSWRRPLPAEHRKILGIADGEEAWVKSLRPGRYAPSQHSGKWWFTPTSGIDGNFIEMPEAKPTLYGLQVITSDKPVFAGKPVFVVEGERKVDLLLGGLGLVAASGPNGAESWDREWGKWFAGRKVVIIPDNNVPGMKYADAVSSSLLFHGAAGVKLILPGPSWNVEQDKDVYDWLMMFGQGERFTKLSELLTNFPAYHLASRAA